jgi:hypothetical protein
MGGVDLEIRLPVIEGLGGGLFQSSGTNVVQKLRLERVW